MTKTTTNDQCVNIQTNLRKDHLLFAQCLVDAEIRASIKLTVKKPDELPELDEGHQFLCPISHQAMENPVTTNEGFTFDLKNIEQWLRISETNPLTRQPLTKGQLTPNKKLKKKIDYWKQGEIEQDSFFRQGGSEEAWRRYEIIRDQLLERRSTISFKRTTKGVSTDLLVKYHKEVFSSIQTRKEILSFYEGLGMIKLNSKSFPDESFCRNKMGLDSFERAFFFKKDFDFDTRLKILTVKNMLVYEHPDYHNDLIKEIMANVEDPDEVKVKKLISSYLSEAMSNIWWAQGGNEYQAFCNKYAPIYTGSFLKTVILNSVRWPSCAMLDVMKLLFFCPDRAIAFSDYLDNSSLKNAKEVLKSGVAFALIAILLERGVSVGIFNYYACPEYKTFIKDASAKTWCDLLKANPGMAIFIATSLGISAGHTLKRATKGVVNWECAYGDIMSGDLKKAGKAFADHPSLAGILVLVVKEGAYNNHARKEYGSFIKDASAKTWCDLLKANPGMAIFIATSLGGSTHKVLRKTFIDSKGMKIPFFEFLRNNENYFEIFRNCDIPINELYINNNQLKNLNEISEKNYLKIRIDNKIPSEELIKNLRDKLKIIIPPQYSNVFQRFWAQPNCKNTKSMLKNGGAIAGTVTYITKGAFFPASLAIRYCRPTKLKRKNETEVPIPLSMRQAEI